MATTPGAGSRILQAAKQKLADIASTQRAKVSDAHASKQVTQAATPAAKTPRTRAAGTGAPTLASKAGNATAVSSATPTNGTAGKSTTDRVASVEKVTQRAISVSRKATATVDPANAASAPSPRAAPAKRADSTDSPPAAKPRAKPRISQITPAQALANTQKLLAAKNEQARQPQAWQDHDNEHSGPADPDFQSPEAMVKATELHSGESYKSAIQGSIGTQDRHNQGKRDSR